MKRFIVEHKSVYRAGRRERITWHEVEAFATRAEAEALATELKRTHALTTRIVATVAERLETHYAEGGTTGVGCKG